MEAGQGIAAAELRPLSLGELLDRTFTLYRNHFWLFVGLMAVPYSLVLALSLLIQGLSAAGPDIGMAAIAGAGLLMLVFFLALIIVFGLTQAATIFALSEVYLGRSTTIRETYSRIWGDIGRVIFVQILVSLGIFVGIILLIVPGIWFALRAAVSIPVAIIEDLQAGDAVRRSMELTKGFTGRVALIFLLMLIISWVAAFVLQFPFMLAAFAYAASGKTVPYWLNMISSVADTVANVLAGPLGIIAFSVLYFDLRVRKEGFDLKVMMDRLSVPTPRAPFA
ncbi:MAG TPA: hypothetical protein VNN18_10200 [Candidatus Xenobia bacterium]|nr:hypothetical protein [Candidatus Xenobia bacterium]